VREAIEREFAGRAAFPQNDATIIQSVHPDVDKAAALQRVAAGYGIPAERVCAIGDAPNDAGMLRWAGLGLAGSYLGAKPLGIPFVFDPSIVVIALVFAALVGIVFGYLPARRAARMDPIEALRHE